MTGELAVSAKDRAEHVMIVNLVRNDLGRVARPGGVRVARLFDALPDPLRGAPGQRGRRRPARGRRAQGAAARRSSPAASVTGYAQGSARWR